MPAAKGRTLRGLLVLVLAVATTAPAAASLPWPAQFDVDPAALLAAARETPAPEPPTAEPVRFALLEEPPGNRFELLDPAIVEHVAFTGRSPQPHLFAELETRVRAIDFLGWTQPQEIQWFEWQIAPGGHVGPNLYQYALNNPASFSDPMGLAVSVDLKELEQNAQERQAILAALEVNCTRSVAECQLMLGLADSVLSLTHPVSVEEKLAPQIDGLMSLGQPLAIVPARAQLGRAAERGLRPLLRKLNPFRWFDDVVDDAVTQGMREFAEEGVPELAPRFEIPRPTLQKIFEMQRGKGNFGIGQLTRGQADELGRAFVGSDAVPIVRNGQQIGLRSPDGLRVFRFPADKKFGQAAGRVQANIEEFFVDEAGNKVQVRNAHIDIIP